MSVLLFLNELSCGGNTPRREVDQAMAEWVDVLRYIHKVRVDVALVSDVRLKSTELASGYFVQQWISADPKNRDRWRFIRTVQNRAPFSAVVPEAAAGDVEYRYEDRLTQGLGAAHLADGLAVSLGIGESWKDPCVTLERSTFSEDDVGEVVLTRDNVEVRHAASRVHVDHHKRWVQEVGKDGLTSGLAIWENREASFPHLKFLPRVEGDLRGLSPGLVRSVVELLFKLERAVADWEPERSHAPHWRTRVTPESDTRRSLCEFPDIDGIIRVFELHARFTPGPGRLHFRLVPHDRSIHVAFIGRKIP